MVNRMKKEIDKMYEQEPKTWYAKILVALIVAALLAWSMSTVQSGTTGGDGLTVAGKIISGKEEIADFLTGQRKEKDESEWLVTIRPELRIIEEEVFDKAQDILKGRHDSFKITHERQSNKYLFSTLIKCKECGWSFRRTVRQYKNTYVRWVCSGHNGKGADSCPNAVTVDEEELIQALQEYFQEILSKKKKVINYVIKEFQRVYKAKDENIEYEKQLNAELNKLHKSREKYMDMYTDDLISREELNCLLYTSPSPRD